MKKTLKKGFTLIELLVVVAIIGILATVVLSSLNSARGKAEDAKVKAQMQSMHPTAILHYDDNGNYTAVCADMTAMTASAGSTCTDEAGAWASISAALNAADPDEPLNTSWCVDSTGYTGFASSVASEACVVT